MPFLLLLLLTLVCLVDPWPEPFVRLGSGDNIFAAITGSILLTSLTMLLQGILTVAAARSTAEHLHLFPDDREKTIRRYGRLRFYLFLTLLAGYSLSLWGWGWGWAVQTLCTLNGPARVLILPGAEFLTLAPLFGTLVLSWACLYRADHAIHATASPIGRAPFFAGRREYVGFQLRQNLALVLVPLLLLLAEKGASRLWPSIYEVAWHRLLAAGVLGCIFLGFPWMLRLVLGLKPLPPGPVRDRLDAASRRLRFRCSDILSWDTRGVAANALVAGLLPWPRYVVLTDRLVGELAPDEVEAVFGHEVGHVRHRHMLYYLVFLLLSIAALAGLWGVVANTAQTLVAGDVPAAGAESIDRVLAASGLRVVPFVVLLGTYIFVVFGFLSRRCERQADLFGCLTVSCGRKNCCGHETEEGWPPRGDALCPTGIRTFIGALEKVAYLNGISRDRPGWLQSWQHSTIARRVDFLQRVLSEPRVARRFQRNVLWVKCGLIVGLAVVVAGVWLPLLWPGVGQTLITWIAGYRFSGK